jgi:hypothetical protein
MKEINRSNISNDFYKTTLDIRKNQFLEKFKELHGDLIETDFIYESNKKQVLFTCKKHGAYLNTPRSLINHGLKCCTDENEKNIQKDNFLHRVSKIHGDKYDLSLVNDFSIRSIIQVICGKHGIFDSTISNFAYSKHGCKKCAHDIMRKTLTDFINESNIVHNFKYDYSKVEYMYLYYVKNMVFFHKHLGLI